MTKFQYKKNSLWIKALAVRLHLPGKHTTLLSLRDASTFARWLSVVNFWSGVLRAGGFVSSYPISIIIRTLDKGNGKDTHTIFCHLFLREGWPVSSLCYTMLYNSDKVQNKKMQFNLRYFQFKKHTIGVVFKRRNQTRLGVDLKQNNCRNNPLPSSFPQNLHWQWRN